MTKEQDEICYSIKLALIKSIVDYKNEDMWIIIERAMKESISSNENSETDKY